jgi:hypothetical protein
MPDMIYACSTGEHVKLYLSLPEGIKSFISESEWIEKITEIKANTSGLISFRKRFFGWFNMFKIVRYLNVVHPDMYQKKPVEEAAYELLVMLGSDPVSKAPEGLLMQYRKMEKTS